MTTDLLAILLAPALVGGVIGAWVMAGRLFAARLLPGKPRLPVWIPWALAPPVALIGYVFAAAQIIAAGTGAAGDVAAERGAAALMAVLLSPVWIGSAALAVLGIVLHYGLDGALAHLQLDDGPREGLALGLRAAWALVGLLSLFLGLQVTYRATANGPATLPDLTASVRPAHLLVTGAALVLTVLGMILPALVERDPVFRFSEEAPSSPPPPPPDRSRESG